MMRVATLWLLACLGVAGSAQVPIKILFDKSRHDLIVARNKLPAESIYRFNAKDIDGEPVELAKFAGKVGLIVNVASK